MARRDDLPVLKFSDAEAFGTWLATHHKSSPGLWLMIPKKGRGVSGPSYTEALDEALRFGWIDSHKEKHDEDFFLQRFTPRTSRSRWSKVNREKIEALEKAGRMEPAGELEVQRAKEDGRWEAAYDSMSTATVPADLERALKATPKTLSFFEGLSASQRYRVLYSVQEAKRPETRVRRIEKFVGMCARGESP